MFKPSTRIITGSLKGKPLMLPDDAAVRPTRERVRQAVFNMLASRLEWHGLQVADLCCGSGAWGLEALSRGAAAVWLVDTNLAAARANVAALGLHDDPRLRLVQADASGWTPPALLDVVLADPPYHSGLAQNLLEQAGCLAASGGWWALELAGDETLDDSPLTETTRKTYGNSQIVCGRFFSPAQG